MPQPPKNEFSAPYAHLTADQRAALEVLEAQDQRLKVRDVYDAPDAAVADALNLLIPDFEYPDFSWKTIGEVIQAVNKLVRVANAA